MAVTELSDPRSQAAPGGETPPVEPLGWTGERTLPDLVEENYWFRRHEIAYQHVLPLVAGKDLLEAGPGEGYGANYLAGAAHTTTAMDYDAAAVAHIRRKYPVVEILEGNLVQLPFPSDRFDVIVNFQVIEHLWDQVQFLRECARTLRPGGLLLCSTPNRLTFTPDRDTPLNPYHTRELSAAEFTEILEEAGLTVTAMEGIWHGPRLTDRDRQWGGSFVNAQLERSLAGEPWPPELRAAVADTRAADFVVDTAGHRNIDTSLDLLAHARAE